MLQKLKKISKIPFIVVREIFTGLFYDVDETFTGALNIEDPRTYEYSEVFGAGEPLEEVDMLDKLTEYQNQNLNSLTRYMCTCYAESHCSDILEYDNTKNYLKGSELGEIAIENGKLQRYVGAYLIDILNLSVKLKQISAFTRITTNEQIKQSLTNGHPIYWGTNRVDWTKTRKNNNTFVVGKSYGHCMSSAKYDKDFLYVINSDGKEYRIRWEDVQTVMFNTKYALHLEDENIKELLKMIEYFKDQKAKGIAVVNSYSALGKTYRQQYNSVIMLALRKVSGKVIKKSDLI